MDFVAVMFLTQQVFHLECLLFRIKSQSDVACKSVIYKKVFSVVFRSSENGRINLPHEFIFVFMWHFIGPILWQKFCQRRGEGGGQGFGKNIVKGGWPQRGGCI